MEDLSNMSTVSEDRSSSFNIPENDPDLTKKIKMEEQRMKRKLKTAENKAKKKQIELEEQEHRKERAIKGMNFLLSKSQMYSKYLGTKLSVDFNSNQNQKRKSEVLKECVVNDDEEKCGTTDNCEVPKYFTGGTLRPYQLEGLTWLKLLFENGINGILADEMGLGKTIQVIALICHLYEKNLNGPYLIIAPLSVVTNWICEFKTFAPKIPTIFFHGNENERNQIKKEFVKDFKIDGKSVRPVVITTYQIPVIEHLHLSKFKWSYLILDEAQNIKNYLSQRHIAIDKLRSLNRLLLTGTPLQNNLIELWSLLHFLMPNIFSTNSDNTFTSVLNLDDFNSIENTVENDKLKNIISTIHGVLNPFLLRRLKKDVLKDIVPKKELIVYCPLSDMQRTLTKYVIERNLNLLAGKKEDEIDVNAPRSKRKCVLNRPNYSIFRNLDNENDDESEIYKQIDNFKENNENNIKENKELLQMFGKNNVCTVEDGIQIIRRVGMQIPKMSLRQIANHPYLVHMPVTIDKEGKKTMKVDENLIKMSGKMCVLDLLLPRLINDNHKVLIFSFFVMMLDIVEEYLIYRKFQYSRLDGQLHLNKRNTQIENFRKDPETFIFLISTRAGGTGLNLTEADTVIFVDSDLNPQTDIQAQDRCHRIGQTKPVMVYKLVSNGTIDETILKRGEMKKRLEKVIIKNGGLDSSKYTNGTFLTKDDLIQLLKSVSNITEIHSNSTSTKSVLSKQEIDQILDRSELCKEVNELKES